ncbi:MAG: hypothetical protein HY918_04355 [Candidatus Doudnabacteria bacterium]|nr:hypothetical protein [Candidatus Doudnabacteria bacterium]
MPTDQKKIYCSLDIETSGFDPLVNEILEVGFAFFEVGNKGIKITEEWTKVFKPVRPVSSNILGLTGISQEELDEAPAFSEFREELQEKLGDTIIVGHNISFDIKFLEAFGIKFSGKQIDTLDLVQWLLPTHHSYNLENLMHTFGISHKEAHRALADSKATLKLLEKLLQVFCGFPETLKEQIYKLIKPQKFLWEEFLKIDFSGINFSEISNKPAKKVKSQIKKDLVEGLAENSIYNFTFGEDFIKQLPEQIKVKGLLVLPKVQEVLALYKQGLVDGVAFMPELKFNEKKFKAALKKKKVSPEELRFLLKVLVWQMTNWQTESIIDMNLSFFGGQFKGLVSGEKLVEKKSAKLVACDLQTFFHLSENKLYAERQAVICGLNNFEAAIVSNIGTKTSWGYINYLLKSFYNPEFQTGEKKFKAEVEEALAASDLFFGLASALLQSDPPGFVYFKVNEQTENEERFVKIKTAAKNYEEKISKANETLGSEEVSSFIANFQNFFQPESNKVKWVELSENRCSFLSMPLNITGLVEEALKGFSSVVFADALGSGMLLDFFIKRLGLEKFTVINANNKEAKLLKKPGSKQGDLFSGLKKALGVKSEEIRFHFLPNTISPEYLSELFKNGSGLPAAALLPSPSVIREFYDAHYQDIKKFASLYAQTNSGGSNKIFRNFSINQNGLLLATDKFVLRHMTAPSAVDPVQNLEVKTLVVCRLPFEQFTHPYQEAVSQSLNNAFMDYALPKALLNFHNLLRFFYTPKLQDVYIVDAKLAKDYAKVFKDYYKSIPKAKIK